MKRLFDVILSFFGLLIFSPILLPVMLLVWLQDLHSPFYIAPRVSKGGGLFCMVKLRSMKVNTDKSGVDSTAGDDPRITDVGKFIRKFKLDELSQLWNVFIGDMSLVGPRPNVKSETDLYTDVEQKLLTVRPGITDISSIVFSDEGNILEGKEDPDIAYNQLIRPWKSRLGLVYIENRSLSLDLKLLFLTAVAIFSREKALKSVNKVLRKLKTDEKVIQVALRIEELQQAPPPGSDSIVKSRV